jgi:hypothetical protein
MILKIPVQLKASLLLIVFSLNTIVGIACVCGIGVSNTSHDSEDEKVMVTKDIHEDCKKQTDSGKKDHNSKEHKGNCCTDQVMKFNKTDKSVTHSLIATINPAFFSVFVSSFYNIDILYTSYVNTNIKYFVRSYHPPIPDIRIAIQSFQI